MRQRGRMRWKAYAGGKPNLSPMCTVQWASSWRGVNEDRCLEKHPHGDVAHAVGLPLGLHIILLDARIKG